MMYRVIILACLSLLVSCNETEESTHNELLSRLVPLTDSIPEETILAKYVEKNSLAVLVSQDSAANTVVKFIFSETEPVAADTLIRTGLNIYASKLFPSVYELKDCQVTETQSMKTIHPSSNWQGQTPGEKAVTFTFKNIK